MDDRKEIDLLLDKHNKALNQVAHPELDNLLKVPFKDCPYFSDFYEKRNYEKGWYTIDSDVFFDKVISNFINYDPLFQKASFTFKKRLKMTMNVLFNDENQADDRNLQNPSKKYPSWARFWYDFSLKSLIHGEFPWEDHNDSIIFWKYNSYQSDVKKVNMILGFDFQKEYERIKKIYPDPFLDKQIQKHKNSINKKVS